jgi:3-oxoisoapionate kinase
MTRPIVCFYGDDFTGSTDCLFQYQRWGLSGILLTSVPPAAELQSIAATVDVVGVAGLSRSMPPDALVVELFGAFRAFAALHPRVVQYKICSTFDSSKAIGNIGRACEVGLEVFSRRPAPVLVAQPEFGRYTAFGNHFARGNDGRVHRLDRHPTMSCHPVTPMSEASIRSNLSEQAASLRVSEFHLLDLWDSSDRAESTYREIVASGIDIVVVDAMSNDDLQKACRMILSDADDKSPLFCVGSGGLSFGIASSLVEERGPKPPDDAALLPHEIVLAVSGSCSLRSAEQIEHAIAAGWVGVRLDPDTLSDTRTLEQATETAMRALRFGRSVVAYTALGQAEGKFSAELVGTALARLVEVALKRTDVRRVVVAGGDTSGHVMRALPVSGLSVLRQITPAGALCTTMSSQKWLDGVEIMLKGGQVGGPALFETLRRGV